MRQGGCGIRRCSCRWRIRREMQTVSFRDERGIGQGSPQAFILGSQAFALSRNPRQLFSETLELPHNRIIARASRRCAFKAASRAGTLRLKHFGKLFPELL